MHDFRYVSKKEAAPVKAELLEIIHEVQDIVRDDFTFQYTFIGSSSRNMITEDIKSNIGYDFDVNLEVNDDEENFSAEQIKLKLKQAFDSVAWRYGYDHCEDSTRVLTLKVKDREHSRILHSVFSTLLTEVLHFISCLNKILVHLTVTYFRNFCDCLTESSV